MINKDIQLTAEQRDCVNFPLSQQVLIINAGPGTGKTEIIKERTRFIVEQNLTQQQLILVLAFNKNISLDIWRKLKLIISENVVFLQKNSEFSKRGKFSPFQIMNRTFHSLCYLIFSKEIEIISEKFFQLIPEKVKKDSIFPFFTDSTSNFVEMRKKQEYWKSSPPSERLKSIIFGRLNRYVLKKKNQKLKDELINKETWKKLHVKKEEKPIIYQKIIYEEYLQESYSILEKVGRLDIYEPVKNFFLREQAKNFWLSFDNLIESVKNLLQENGKIRKRWQIFDHVLVDECQDLTRDQLNIVKLLCQPQTTLTFVGDPKQTIYGFRGAQRGVFSFIRNIFPNNAQKNITESFRSHQGIVAVANDFSRKFLREWHYADLKSRKEGGKPIIFLGENSQKQMSFLVEQIDQIREPAIKSILFRQQKTGNEIEDEFRELNREFIKFGDNENNKKNLEIIDRLKKLKPEEVSNFNNVKDLLEKLEIQFTDPDFDDFVENFDKNLEIEREKLAEEKQLNQRQISRFNKELEDWTLFRLPMDNLAGKIILSTVHGSKGLEFDYVFLVDINEGILPSKKVKSEEEELEEGRVFYVGITRARKKLYLCCSDRDKISQFIRKLDSNLIEIKTGDIIDLPKTNSTLITQEREEMIGEEGEEKVYNLLAKSQIPFLKLLKNWETISNLQIDIYAETTQLIYFVEVKNWSWDYYSRHQEEVLEQQLNREQTINKTRWGPEKKEINKNFIYIICFFYWKMAQDFRDFYQQIESGRQQNQEKLLFAFYEEPDEEFTFLAHDQIRRVDDWIKATEKKYDSK